MKIKLVYIFLFLSLCSARCNKSGENCHTSIVVVNSTNTRVVFATQGYYGDLCLLSKIAILDSGGQSQLNLWRTCWEDELRVNPSQDIYVLDTTGFNVTNANGYSCDSIAFKNKILKHYMVTLDDLKRNNFTVTYR